MASIPITILSSGGIDSTALIHRHISKRKSIRLIHFQYRQPNRRSELKAVKSISKHYGVGVDIVKLGFGMFRRGYELVGRNAAFALVASFIVPPPSRIAIGIHRGPEYYDTSSRFITDCQRILDGYFNGTVVLEAPFVNLSKRDIVSYCKKRRIPLQLTYSCQVKNDPPCRRCPSCLDRMSYLGSK